MMSNLYYCIDDEKVIAIDKINNSERTVASMIDDINPLAAKMFRESEWMTLHINEMAIKKTNNSDWEVIFDTSMHAGIPADVIKEMAKPTPGEDIISEVNKFDEKNQAYYPPIALKYRLVCSKGDVENFATIRMYCAEYGCKIPRILDNIENVTKDLDSELLKKDISIDIEKKISSAMCLNCQYFKAVRKNVTSK